MDTRCNLEKQNNPEMIKLLRASTVAYKKAKRWETSISFFLTALAIAYPIYFVYSTNEEIKLILFGLSFVITILVELYYNDYKGNTISGALFKEQFDVEVFGLPWKTTLPRPDSAEIAKYSFAYNGHEIRDWYDTNISSKAPSNAVIAICQRINTGWDIDLRKTYCRWLKVFLILYSFGLFLFFICERTDGRTIFSVCFSLLSFYTHFFTIIRGHINVISKRKDISKQLDELIFVKKNAAINELRDIQDEIFITRQESAKVPNFFFRLYKRKMNLAFVNYLDSVNRTFNNPPAEPDL